MPTVTRRIKRKNGANRRRTNAGYIVPGMSAEPLEVRYLTGVLIKALKAAIAALSET